MNPVIESLLQIVEVDPLPVTHTSSHWEHFARDVVVERQGDRLVLRGLGIVASGSKGAAWRTVRTLERLTYRRVTAALSSFPYIWKLARCLAHDLSQALTYDNWRFTVVLAVLADHWAAHMLSPRTFVMIGDGGGFLGALVRRYCTGARMYCIDLPKALVFQARTHETADPVATMSLLSTNVGGEAEITFVLPRDIELIHDQIDCAINIASMQEMNELSIASYFTFLRRRSTPRSRFYCVNRLRKELPGGEIVSFAEYPWREDDEVFIDGPCPYYTHFFTSYTLSNGPRLLGVRMPFINYFDGVMVHRLARLASIS